MPKHLDAHIFDLPVQELRRGYRSDIYFWREKITLEKHHLHPNVTMQVFQKRDAVLCGIDEVLAVLVGWIDDLSLPVMPPTSDDEEEKKKDTDQGESGENP